MLPEVIALANRRAPTALRGGGMSALGQKRT